MGVNNSHNSTNSSNHNTHSSTMLLREGQRHLLIQAGIRAWMAFPIQ
jgi:hypothetical protein